MLYQTNFCGIQTASSRTNCRKIRRLEGVEVSHARKLVGDRKEIISNKYPDLIWCITGMSGYEYPIIFFYTDEALKKAHEDGTTMPF